MAPNYRQIMAIKAANKKKILEVCPEADEAPGIYWFWREDAAGIRYGYLGQATKSLLQRLAEHLSGYQHIDLSIKKHKFYSEDNAYGYHIEIVEHCSPEECDEREQYWIKYYANQGFQLRNKTTGSQSEGKAGMDSQKPARGYHDGLNQGYKNAQKYVAGLFEKNLTYSINGKPGKRNQAAYDKFTEFINANNTEEEDEV
jgi:hypothetical protein